MKSTNHATRSFSKLNYSCFINKSNNYQHYSILHRKIENMEVIIIEEISPVECAFDHLEPPDTDDADDNIEYFEDEYDFYAESIQIETKRNKKSTKQEKIKP